LLSKTDRQAVHDLLSNLSTAVYNKQTDHFNNRVALALGKDALIVQQFSKELGRIFKRGYITPLKYPQKPKHKIQRLVSLVLSDTHFQALLDKKETPLEYKAVQESRRMGKLAQQVVDYKSQYRNESGLCIHVLGDLIQNHLHDPRDGAPNTIQFGAAVHYLVQFILFTAAQYPRVWVGFTPGNHGRDLSRHSDRATLQKWDAIETMVAIAVKAAIKASGLPNVVIDIPFTPYYTKQLFDATGFFTHGDTVLKPGIPGKTIKTDLLYKQICRWNNARNIGGPFKLFCCGHVHFGSVTNMPSGVVMMTNGCLIPPDSFSLSIDVPDVTCGQYMFESVERHAVGDQRFIIVDDAEQDADYNKIITPYGGLL
jgi:hypothetical protein